ncbi:hypothetical protein B0T16DRAFT_409111 [Cercophora newfieldiana]|uniref:Uncharacterized protein n=1 Tax=Cercophora newfieldiana TaxID=92897 RepID=A0AA39YAA1_9PEZI|nr:hypothetical protein B0T16DRAFT_409111 [Cercophora newfieldiana]
MPPRDPMPNMSRSAWHTFNNETKVEWARKVRNGTFTDAARSLYADDVARRTTRQLSPPTSDAPSTSTVHSDDASPGSSTSVGARNTSREEDVVFLLSLKKDATNKRKRLAESGQSSKRRASGERPQTEVSSPTAHRPKGTRGSGKGKEKATKDITSAQRQRIPSPEPESETEYSSSPPGSPRPGVSHHKPSDRPALPIEGDLQTTVSDLSRRLSKIEQSTLTILERLDNKDNYITKTVAQKLGDKVSSPEFVDKMREILKTVVKEELESMDQSLEKKQRVLGKRLEERVREVDDNMKSLVQHEIKQEVSRVGQKIKMRDLEKIPAMRGTLDDLKDQVELLNGQVQSLGSVKSPSDTAVQGILQRLGEIEGRLRAPEPGYAAPDRRGAAYRDQRERGAPPGVPHGMPGDPSYANDYDEPAGPSYRSRYYSSPVSRYRRAI